MTNEPAARSAVTTMAAGTVPAVAAVALDEATGLPILARTSIRSVAE
nr:hypothetical protein [uncultured Rhodococcus sp.]